MKRLTVTPMMILTKMGAGEARKLVKMVEEER
jgi:hypothetical protein